MARITSVMAAVVRASAGAAAGRAARVSVWAWGCWATVGVDISDSEWAVDVGS
jgi:hypothetical protein